MTVCNVVIQKDGIGRWASCSIGSRDTEEMESLVTDRCAWDTMKETYRNAVIGVDVLNWKRSVISGMQCAIEHTFFEGNKEFELLDVNGHVAHSDCISMFIVGFKSVLEEMGLPLLQADRDAIENLLSTKYELHSEAVSDVSIKFGFYRADADKRPAQ